MYGLRRHPYKFNYGRNHSYLHNTTLRWPTPGGLTRPQVMSYCSARLDESDIYKACEQQLVTVRTLLIQQCMEIIQVFVILANPSIFSYQQYNQVLIMLILER